MSRSCTSSPPSAFMACSGTALAFSILLHVHTHTHTHTHTGNTYIYVLSFLHDCSTFTFLPTIVKFLKHISPFAMVTVSCLTTLPVTNS
jgi:hypothetical protein